VHELAQGSPALLAAGALFLIGFGVKVALVPMHTWLPDAHTQAPSGISAMLSGVVIEAGLVALLRVIALLNNAQGEATSAANWGSLLMSFGALNMIVGNLMALRQVQVKRLLAYSSLSHIGYMALGLGIAIYAGEAAGAQGGMFHLLNHGLMKGLAFLAAGAILYATSHMGTSPNYNDPPQSHGPLTIPDLNGAAQRYPLAALAFSLAVLGLGGLPPLAGFMSKWQIFVAGFNTHNLIIILLVVFAALNSVLSLAYYAPLVNAVYRKQPSEAVLHGASIPMRMSLPLALLALAVVGLGIWPAMAEWLTGSAGRALMAAFGGL
jgi:formate hydrogenlyase subunit 3/multisubunit Na+/H+ antiporter MnhD subunit